MTDNKALREKLDAMVREKTLINVAQRPWLKKTTFEAEQANCTIEYALAREQVAFDLLKRLDAAEALVRALTGLLGIGQSDEWECPHGAKVTERCSHDSGCPLGPKDCELKALRSEVEALRKRNEELEEDTRKQELAHLDTIRSRDNAEDALSEAYWLVMDECPEWSSSFGFKEALDAMNERLGADIRERDASELRAQELETKLRAAEDARKEAADAAVVLREALEAVENAVTGDNFGRPVFRDGAYPGAVVEAALSNTSALAASQALDKKEG